jgi:hypothetical protein
MKLELKRKTLVFVGAIVSSVTAGDLAFASQIDISGLVNSDLTTYSGGSNYPQNGGSLTVAGVTFQLSTIAPNNNTAVIQGSTAFGVSETYTIPVNLFGIQTVDTLINSAFGTLGTDIGSLVFHGAGGETFTYTLTEGFNVRDHFEDGFVNSATNLAGTANFGNPPGTDRLDMQEILLPAIFASATLTSIDFNSFGQGGNGAPFVAAIDAFTTSATPLPAALPLFAGGLGALGLLGWRRKRKTRTRSILPA